MRPNPENYRPLDMSKVRRLPVACVEDLPPSHIPTRIQESTGFKPSHQKVGQGDALIDYPIDAGTNIILESAEQLPCLSVAMFDYDGLPTIHMIQRAKRVGGEANRFVISMAEFGEYKDHGLSVATEIARRSGQRYLQIVSGLRNIWLYDPDANIPLSVFFATYDKGLRERGFQQVNVDGSTVRDYQATAIGSMIKRVLSGKHQLSWPEIQDVAGDFYFWRKQI